MDSVLEKRILKYMKGSPHYENTSINVLRDMYENGELILNPDYQRNYILRNSEASKFIESVFLGCPIPEIQFYKDEHGVCEVVDGQQRLTAFLKFLKGEYKLTKLKELTFLNGLTINDLNKELIAKFKQFNLSVKTINFNENKDYKYFVFERLNTGSSPLNQQEIRNCIYRGDFLNMIKRLACNDEISQFLNIDNKRFQREEFILRSMVVSEEFEKLYSTVQHNINLFLLKRKELTNEYIQKIEFKYIQTIKFIKENFTQESFNSFTKTEQEAIFILFYKFLDKDKIKKQNCNIQNIIINTIHNDEIYLNSVTIHPNQRKDVRAKVFRMWEIIIQHFNENKIKELSIYKIYKEKLNLFSNDVRKKLVCSVCSKEILEFQEFDYLIKDMYGETIDEKFEYMHKRCKESLL